MRSLAVVPLLACMLASRPPEGRDLAKREFARGMQHYNLGEFAIALRHFKAAYEVEPHADLLFDIGQCHRNLGENDRAIFFFERYVEEMPEGTAAEEVKALLIELKAMEPIAYDPPPLTSTIASSTYDLTLPVGVERDAPKPLHEKWWFWAALMGAATVAAGSVVLISALTDADRAPHPPTSFEPAL